MVVPLAGGEPPGSCKAGGSVARVALPDTLLALHQDGYGYALLDPEAGTQRSNRVDRRCPSGSWVRAQRLLLCNVNDIVFLVDPATGARVREVRVGDRTDGPDPVTGPAPGWSWIATWSTPGRTATCAPRPTIRRRA